MIPARCIVFFVGRKCSKCMHMHLLNITMEPHLCICIFSTLLGPICTEAVSCTCYLNCLKKKEQLFLRWMVGTLSQKDFLGKTHIRFTEKSGTLAGHRIFGGRVLLLKKPQKSLQSGRSRRFFFNFWDGSGLHDETRHQWNLDISCKDDTHACSHLTANLYCLTMAASAGRSCYDAWCTLADMEEVPLVEAEPSIAWKLLKQAITTGQFITTSAEVTPNGGLVRESLPKWP